MSPALLALWGCTGCRPTAPVTLPDPPAAELAWRTPAGTLGQSMGINEALAVPARLLVGMPPDQIDALLLADAQATHDLGATWVRNHTAVYPGAHAQAWSRDPDALLRRTDRWVHAAQSQDLEVLFMLSPWPGNATATHTQTYLPDQAAYQAYVSAVVERYDGDGLDDMPGLTRPIRHWEVDNEPDLKHTLKPRGGELPPDFCLPSEYATLALWTAEAVRAADPDAVVVAGAFYRPMTETGAAYAQAVLSSPGLLDAVDVVSLHVYGDGPGLERWTRAIDTLRAAAPGKPLWITETNQPDTASADGAHVARIHALAWGRGVEKVFWHTLADPPPRARKGPGMDHHSLLQAQPQGGFTDKPAATVYRDLARAVADTPYAALQSSDGELVGDTWRITPEGALLQAE